MTMQQQYAINKYVIHLPPESNFSLSGELFGDLHVTLAIANEETLLVIFKVETMGLIESPRITMLSFGKKSRMFDPRFKIGRVISVAFMCCTDHISAVELTVHEYTTEVPGQVS